MFVSTLCGDLPSATLTSTFFTDATGGYPGGVWYFLPPLPDRAASNRGPGHSTVLTGSSLHGGPQWTTTDQHCKYRNLCCTWYDAYVPLRHLTDCQVGAANGAGPSECTAGVTPAPSENLGQED